VAPTELANLELVKRRIDMAPLLWGVLRTFADRAARRGVALELVADWSHGACAFADPIRLRWVIVDVISNALKRAGWDARLRIELVETDGEVHLCLSDTGNGMTPAQLDRLFEPRRRRRAGGEAVKGVRPAMMRARQLVLLMDGQILVQSMVGEGTTVYLKFPAAEFDQQSLDSAGGSVAGTQGTLDIGQLDQAGIG